MIYKKYLIEKGKFRNIFNVPFLKKISLRFSYKEKKNLVIAGSALKILTGKKPFLLIEKTDLSRKGKKDILGCQVNLKKDQSLSFLVYLISFIFPQMPYFKGFLFKEKNFSIVIENLLLFPELEKDMEKYYQLKNLEIKFYFLDKN